MAHPHKKDASDATGAKLAKMTKNYGLADPSANKLAPVNEQKGSGSLPEDVVGFGSDANGKTAKRGDKPARKSTNANPVATYAKGGKVGSGGMTVDGNGGKITKHVVSKGISEGPTGGDIVGRARGGRLKAGKKHGTHVNVIVAPQGGPPQGMAGPSPQLAGLAAGAHPPMPMPPAPPPGGPPPGGPMAAGPMPPGPPGGPPPMMGRKRGGKVTEEGLVKRAKGGGLHLKGGSISGEGRLEKYMHQKAHPIKPQEV